MYIYVYKNINSIWSKVSFKDSVSLLIFCFNDLSVVLSGVLKSPALFVLWSDSPFMSVNICFTYLGATMLGAYIFTVFKASCLIDP